MCVRGDVVSRKLYLYNCIVTASTTHYEFIMSTLCFYHHPTERRAKKEEKMAQQTEEENYGEEGASEIG